MGMSSSDWCNIHRSFSFSAEGFYGITRGEYNCYSRIRTKWCDPILITDEDWKEGTKMTLDGLLKELQDLNANERETIHKQVKAFKRTRISLLAYIEEMMNFQSPGYDE